MKKFAVLGFGTVGSGVVELFYKNHNKIIQKAGADFELAYILDLRDFPDSPYAGKFTKSMDAILADQDVTVVAECMGGVEPAFTYLKQCLERGISVVTSNKELIAKKGAELLAKAKEHACNCFFEASVGGAIPIIRPLHRCLAANEISAIYGILNGTTNYILNKMLTDGMTFADALEKAQKHGYAEREPSADVDGHDACRKICILSSLAFGKHVYPESVYTKGIREISLDDASSADALDGAVKLIAFVKKLEDGRILPAVMPMFVPHENMISRVDGVFNCVEVCGDAIDRAYFCGRGAGKFPTASAVMGDVIEAVKHHKTVFSQDWVDAGTQDFIAGIDELTCGMFIRFDSNYDAAALSEFAANYLAANGHADEAVSAVNNACLITVPLNQSEREALLDAFRANGMPVSHWMPAMEA
ncbi:MAG: homoserine dehydrogenase [Oscillospiraceae bacterium]|nr:homoserine dehydrogenase [Oscillospiraceae bacterium]MBQ5339678.1 homoserine dehydrogenase [Oscillospiraceae bacterium]MBQ9905970.1 homoserine dehydrogenase [Oscillospiraceae bacterium]